LNFGNLACLYINDTDIRPRVVGIVKQLYDIFVTIKVFLALERKLVVNALGAALVTISIRALARAQSGNCAVISSPRKTSTRRSDPSSTTPRVRAEKGGAGASSSICSGP